MTDNRCIVCGYILIRSREDLAVKLSKAVTMCKAKDLSNPDHGDAMARFYYELVISQVVTELRGICGMCHEKKELAAQAKALLDSADSHTKGVADVERKSDDT